MSLKLQLLQQLECPKNVTYDTVLGHFLFVPKRGVFETVIPGL
jgi:hypothetical protein